MASDSYHEPVGELTDDTREMHRAVASLMEEFEAVDWYNQRVDACKDAELKAILEHNRDEEKEHAAMVLEWIRRKDPVMDKHLRTFPVYRRPDRPPRLTLRLRLWAQCSAHSIRKLAQTTAFVRR